MEAFERGAGLMGSRQAAWGPRSAVVMAGDGPSPAAEPTEAPRQVDPAAFRQLFEDNAGRVYRLLLRLGVTSREVEDLCQEVFVVAHRNWHDFRGDAKRSTWLCGIAVRLAANHRRLARVRRERLSDPQVGTGDVGLGAQGHGAEGHTRATQAEGLDARARAATLHRVLAELPESYRQVLVMYELEELSMAQVTESLGIPLQTGYSRLYAGRKALGQALRRAASQGAL